MTERKELSSIACAKYFRENFGAIPRAHSVAMKKKTAIFSCFCMIRLIWELYFVHAPQSEGGSQVL